MVMYERQYNLDKEINDAVLFMLSMNEKTDRQLNLKKIAIPDDGSACADFYIIDEASNKVVGFLECKNRKYSFDHMNKMGGLFLSKNKYDHLMRWVESGYKAVLLVSFLDSMWFLPLSKSHSTKHGKGGRKDRNDPNDFGDVVYFNNPNDWVFLTKEQR